MTNPMKAYKERVEDIERLMREIKGALKVHAAKQAQKPTDWSFGGDLLSVRQDLIDARNFLTSTMTNEEIKNLVKEK